MAILYRRSSKKKCSDRRTSCCNKEDDQWTDTEDKCPVKCDRPSRCSEECGDKYPVKCDKEDRCSKDCTMPNKCSRVCDMPNKCPTDCDMPNRCSRGRCEKPSRYPKDNCEIRRRSADHCGGCRRSDQVEDGEDGPYKVTTKVCTTHHRFLYYFRVALIG